MINLPPMSQAERIIAKFKTQEQLADAIGCRQNVISGWKKRGFIPAPQQSKVLEAARALSIDLSPADFFELPGDSRAVEEGAAA